MNPAQHCSHDTHRKTDNTRREALIIALFVACVFAWSAGGWAAVDFIGSCE